MREQDPINKGKSDWLNYQGKIDQVREDRKLDKEHQEKVAKSQLAKREARKPQPKNNPNGGFTLG
jgi:hypothetical protein